MRGSRARLAAVGEEHGGRAWTLPLAAEVALARGLESADRAAERYRSALALVTDLEMRPLQAHCRLGLGKLYRQIDRLDDARVELSTGITMLHEMEMALWATRGQGRAGGAGGGSLIGLHPRASDLA